MRRIQQPNHSSDNSALLDKTYLSFKDRKRIIIKTYDKSSLNFQTDVLNFFYTSYHVTILIQIFIAFCEAIFIRSFNSYKNLFESSLGHSDLKITMKYCHDKSESKRKAVEIMSDIYSDSRQKVDTTAMQSVTIRPVSPERMLH